MSSTLIRLNAFIVALTPRWKDSENSMALALLREVADYIEELEAKADNRRPSSKKYDTDDWIEPN